MIKLALLVGPVVLQEAPKLIDSLGKILDAVEAKGLLPDLKTWLETKGVSPSIIEGIRVASKVTG